VHPLAAVDYAGHLEQQGGGVLQAEGQEEGHQSTLQSGHFTMPESGRIHTVFNSMYILAIKFGRTSR
jgi:hypothetical protein